MQSQYLGPKGSQRNRLDCGGLLSRRAAGLHELNGDKPQRQRESHVLRATGTDDTAAVGERVVR
jgi:hypothetical protein